MKSDLVIGLDCGTSGCKAIVWDGSGRQWAEAHAPLPLFRPRPLWHEQPAHAWWEAAALALREAVGGIEPTRLAALGITHQRETFVPVDAQGNPLREAILWMDERAGVLLPDLDRALGRESFHQITGKPLSGNLSVAKLAWLQEQEPAIYREAVKFLDVHAFLVHRLVGRFCTSWGSADPMGLFDMRRHAWSEPVLRVLALSPDRLPELYPPGEVLGEVSEAAGRVCGLPAGLPVVAGLGDGQASGLGAGLAHPERAPGEAAYLSLGTSVISGTFTRDYVTSEQFRTMTGGFPGTYFLETVILGGAYTLDWFVKNMAPDFKELASRGEAAWEDLARQLPPGSEGLLLVPYWNSAMNPYWDARASGVVVGWRGVHRREHLYRAILEGIAFEQRLHTAGVCGVLGRETSRYLAAGGGAASDLWCQILADVTGRQVARVETLETAALGAAMLAAAGVGLFSDLSEAVQAMTSPVRHVFKPDPARHAFYSRLYEDVYRHLYPALRAALGRLVGIYDL